MPEERVTTGSEPRRWPDRRWRIFKSRPDSPTPGEYVEGPPTGGPIEVREALEATAVSSSRAWTLAPDSTDDPPLPYACEGPMLRPDERVRVVEVVEPGHDEQTEDGQRSVYWNARWFEACEQLEQARTRLRALLDASRAWLVSGRSSPDEEWAAARDWLETPRPSQVPEPVLTDEWRPDPRTVAAVVEALRGVADELAPHEPAQASGVLIAKGRIEERFKPSAPEETT